MFSFFQMPGEAAFDHWKRDTETPLATESCPPLDPVYEKMLSWDFILHMGPARMGQ